MNALKDVYSLLHLQNRLIVDLVSELAPVEYWQNGESIMRVKCPECGGEDAEIRTDVLEGPVIVHYGNCPLQYAPLLLSDYIMYRDQLSYSCYCRWLSGKLGGALPFVSPEDERRYHEVRSCRDLLNRLDNVFCAKLFCPEGEDVLRFLCLEKGYLQEEIVRKRWGFYPGYKKMMQDLEGQGYAADAIENVMKWDHHEDPARYRLTFLQRDAKGMPLTMWGYPIPDEGGASWLRFGGRSLEDIRVTMKV